MVSHLPTIDRQPLRLRTPKDGPMSRTRNWPSLPDVGILQRCQPWCLQRCSHRCSQSCQSSNLQRVHGLGVFRGAWPVPAPFQCCLGGARARARAAETAPPRLAWKTSSAFLSGSIGQMQPGSLQSCCQPASVFASLWDLSTYWMQLLHHEGAAGAAP